MKAFLDRNPFVKMVLALLLCAVSFICGWVLSDRSNPDVRLVKQAQQLIVNESIFNNQSSAELSYAAIRGMLSVVNDPFAELIEPEAAQDLINTFSGNTGVIGLYSENQEGQVVVLKVFPGGAAYKAGMKVGDVIFSIDGKLLDEDADSSETGLLMRGIPGTTVDLEIRRDGVPIEFSLIRQEQEFVTSRMLPENIAYISLLAFNKNASQKMKAALEDALAEDPIGLIWDLRNNEGGDMQAAQEILSYFIEDGLLFTAELTKDRTVEFPAKGEAFAAEVPLVILMDGTTYSAGETAAAAISERGRGTTIGSVSYGKGLIQATIPMVNDTLLQMTIAKWLSANGEWYHERGVPPQIEISDDPATESDELLQSAVEFLLDTP